MNPSEDNSEGHILFDDARTMFKWLGLTSLDDVKKQLLKWQTRNNEETARFLGGIQWSHGAEEHPLSCFIGRSCVRDRKFGEEEQGQHLTVVRFPTARWDKSNSMFASAPSHGSACVGRLGNTRDFSSAFSISWRWKQDYNGRGVSAHGRRAGCSRDGEIFIYMPTIKVTGSNLTKAFRELINSDILADCANCAE